MGADGATVEGSGGEDGSGSLLSVWLLRNSRFGRALVALSGSEDAARALGVNVSRYKLAAFVISAIYASIAGSLLVHIVGFVSPEMVGMNMVIMAFTMLNVGGIGTTVGPLIGAIVINNTSPKDGTVLGLGSPTMALDEKLGNKGARFKTSELLWIGRLGPLVNMVFTWKNSPVKMIEDAMKIESSLSGTGAGSTVSIYPLTLNNVLGAKFKLVMGYKGSNEAMLALERAEVEGHSTAFEAVRSAKLSWLKDGSINILAQFGLQRLPELPTVPTAIEVADTPEKKQILTTIMSASEIGTSFFTTPGAPGDRVQALRRAFDATTQDPALIADLNKMGMSMGPMTGEEVQKLIASVVDMSPGLIEKVRKAYPAEGN